MEIKRRKPDNCPCRLCKVYIGSVGFLLISLKLMTSLRDSFVVYLYYYRIYVFYYTVIFYTKTLVRLRIYLLCFLYKIF